MTYGELATELRTRFLDEVSIPADLPTLFDNQEDADIARPDSPWARFSVRPGQANRAEMGGRMHRVTGIAIVQLFTPFGQGDATAQALSDRVATAFRAVAVNGVRYAEPVVQTIGRDGPYWQTNVTCPFQHDHYDA